MIVLCTDYMVPGLIYYVQFGWVIIWFDVDRWKRKNVYMYACMCFYMYACAYVRVGS